MFYSFELGGDPLKKGVFLGIAEGLGVLLVDRLVHLVPDTQGSVSWAPFLDRRVRLLTFDCSTDNNHDVSWPQGESKRGLFTVW